MTDKSIKARLIYTQNPNDPAQPTVVLQGTAKNGQCQFSIEDTNADGQPERIEDRSFVRMEDGNRHAECDPAVTNNTAGAGQAFYHQGIQHMGAVAETVIAEAIAQQKLKRNDNFVLSSHIPRGVARDEWALQGQTEKFNVRIIGNAEGVLYMDVLERDKSFVDDDAMMVRVLDSSARSNPLMRASLGRIFQQIKEQNLHQQTGRAVQRSFPAEAWQAVKNIAGVDHSISGRSKEKEQGATYFETADGNFVHHWPEGSAGATRIPDVAMYDQRLATAQRVVDTHTHPGDEADLSFPSDTDRFAIVARAFRLDRNHFSGVYEHRVHSKYGIFTITPNLELLRRDPELFFRQANAVDFDNARLDAESPQEFLNAVNKFPALQVSLAKR